MPDSKTAQLTFATLLLFASGVVALAQQPAASLQASQNSSTTTLKVTTRLTLENVTVTDAKGRPVHGLTLSDFTVKEDGKLQEIKNFEEYGAEIPSKQSAPPVLPPHVYTNTQPPASNTGAVSILLLDTLNTGPARQAIVRIKAISYLESMPPGTQIAIFEIGSELRLLQGFTTDRAVLLAAMDSFRPTMVINPQIYVPDIPVTCPQPIIVEGITNILNAQTQATVDALDKLAAYASGIKGRKNLIWFTTGLPQITLFTTIFNAMQRYEGDCGTPLLGDRRSDLQKAYSLLTAAQVAIYPVDPRGLENAPGAENVGELSFGPVIDSNTVRQLSFISMQDMAAETGGVAYLNRNDLDAAIGEAIATGSDYYSLSYVPPPSKYDGKYHTIDVKVDRPGLHLRYREGYTDIDSTKWAADEKAGKNAPAPAPDSEFHAAMDHGAAPSDQLRFDVKISPSPVPAKPGDPPVAGMLNPELNGKPLVRYELLFAIPADQITLAEGADGTRKGSVEIDAAAYGSNGMKLNVVRGTANFAGSSDPNPKPFQALVQLDLPSGEVFVRAGVLDLPSQKMGTLEVPETVTKEAVPSVLPQAVTPVQSSAALPAPSSSATVHLDSAEIASLEIALYGKAHPYVDDSVSDLERQVPELKGLKPDPDPRQGENSSKEPQDHNLLPRLLDELGANIGQMYQKIPDLTMDEAVAQQVSALPVETSSATSQHAQCALLQIIPGRGTGSPQSVPCNGPGTVLDRSETFHFLVLAHQTPEGRVLEEDRTDQHNRPPGKDSMVPLFQGSVGSWDIFLPGRRDESRFRYLGEQQIDGRKAFVAAFAQIPGAVRFPGNIFTAGKDVPMLLQGIVWIDEENDQILQLRTDLLAPRPEIRLLTQTTLIHFGPVRIPQVDMMLWLPHHVDAHSEAHGEDIHEQHTFSKHQMFHATARIVVNPAM